jgi:hypothetical protein
LSSSNRRKADRVDVGIPVQLRTRAGHVPAEIVDLSRTGLRVRFFIADMPGRISKDPNSIIAQAGELLSPEFDLNMHYKQLGPLVNKQVTPISVGIPTDAEDTIEVCCEFEGLLEDEESGYLELASPLPPVRDSVDVWVDVESEPGPEPETQAALVSATIPSRPRQRYRALVSGLSPDAPLSIFCHTDLVTMIGVRVRLQREDAGLRVSDDVTVSDALAILIARYGSELDLRLVSEIGDVWDGPARFSGVELPRNSPDEVLATIAFNRRLSLSELRGLGMVGVAA